MQHNDHHIDTLESQLDRIAAIERIVTPLMEELRLLIPKAKARVRAMRREQENTDRFLADERLARAQTPRRIVTD
jgi:hypothetical protein